MEMVMKKKPGLLPYLQSFGRFQIVMTSGKFEGKCKDKGEKMTLIGYAADHMGDTCKMFNPIAKMTRLSRVILEYPGPYQEMNIFNRQPDIDNDLGIDDKEYHPASPPALSLIPEDGDADSKAGRIELSKCSFHHIHFNFQSNGTSMMRAGQFGAPLQVHDKSTNKMVTIQQNQPISLTRR
jgi:hypothetical protein